MKCAICKGTIDKTFLGKPLGSYIKDEKGKKHLICSQCQKKFQTKEEVLKKI